MITDSMGIHNRKLFSALLVGGLFLLSLLVILLWPGFFQAIDKFTIDQLSVWKYSGLNMGKRPSPYIIPVYIDDKSMESYDLLGGDRGGLGILFLLFKELQVKGVGIDLLFAQESVSNDSIALARQAKEAGNVYFPVIFSNYVVTRKKSLSSSSTALVNEKGSWDLSIEKGAHLPEATYVLTPYESLFEAGRGVGHINFDPGERGAFRNIPLFYSFNGKYVPCLALRMVCDYLGISASDMVFKPGKYLLLKGAKLPYSGLKKDIRIPVDKEGRYRFHQAELNKFLFHQYHLDEIIMAAMYPSNRALLRDQLEGSLILISDITSFGRNYSTGSDGKIYPYSYLHLQLMNAILQQDFSFSPGFWVKGLLFLFMPLLFWGIFSFLKPNRAMLLAFGLFFLFLLLHVLLFLFSNMLTEISSFWMPMLTAILFMGIYFYFMGERENSLLRLEVESNRKIGEMNELLLARKKELEFANAKLLEVDRMKTHFFQNITHDFRVPLTLITTPVEGIFSLYRNIPDDLAKKLRLVLNNGKRVLNLVNQLLDLSKLEAGKMELRLSTVELIKLLKEILDAFSPMGEKKKITLSLETSLDSLSVQLDEDKINRIFYNLLMNAFKFTGEGGRIRISVSLDQKSVPPVIEISVQDSGSGIPEGELQSIFNRYSQGDQKGIPSSGGAGIGLALVKEFVELHQGSVSVQSVVGEGAEFFIRLPARPALSHNEVSSHISPHPAQRYCDIRELVSLYTSGGVESEASREAGQPFDLGLSLRKSSDPSEYKVNFQKKFPHIDFNSKNYRFPELPVLVVDDNEDILEGYEILFLSRLINHFTMVSDPREVMPLLAAQEFSLVVLDMSMPYITGDQLLKKIHESYPELPVIIVTGVETVETAAECIRLGAVDYMLKPVEVNRLLVNMERILEKELLEKEVSALSENINSPTLKHPEAFAHIITGNHRMKQVFKYMEFVAGSPKPVLITGESGTGKELIAEALHSLSGRSGEFVKINVAGIDDNAFSDTLFGHKRGAFTGAERDRKGLLEQAAGGTLFMDEIGDLRHESQLKLLRLLQNGEYYPLGSDEKRISSASVILATNENLKQAVEDKRFRKDLYFRLNTHHVVIPALRERLDDLPLLVDHFLALAEPERELAVPGQLFEYLVGYSFPGNIRELEGMITNAAKISEGSELELSSIREYLTRNGSTLSDPDSPIQRDFSGSGAILKIITSNGQLPTLQDSEEFIIREAIKETRGKQAEVARIVGLSQPTIHRRFKHLFSGKK